ncbi:MAG: Gfo/Idh/MocA family oxidoreductase [Anaerolineae bacterium]|nr:Gfo/Idh/MocA family oxidoreductase [Anaerolineae bacterium]
MRQPVRIAIIGCGWAGLRHARACQAVGVRVSWAVDLDSTRAQQVCDSLGSDGMDTRITSDVQQVLHDSTTDAVSLCLPHNLHAPVAIEAAEKGKHILVEKPLAANLAQADAMIASAGQSGLILMVAENVRFHPIYLKISDLIQSGLIGKPAFIHISRQAYLRADFISNRPWFLDEEQAAGGMMMSGGIHDFETMRMLIGDVESVYSLRAPQRFLEMEGDDTSIALVGFRNGVVGMLDESFISKRLTTAAGPEVHTIRIEGSLGSITWDGGQTIRLFTECPIPEFAGALSAHDIHVPEQDTFVAIYEHFMACIHAGQEPLTSGRSQRHALAAVEAAYQSMKSGLPVIVDKTEPNMLNKKGRSDGEL